MGCRHYFIVDRLEDLVDEGDSPIFLDELTNSSWSPHSNKSSKTDLRPTHECGHGHQMFSKNADVSTKEE